MKKEASKSVAKVKVKPVSVESLEEVGPPPGVGGGPDVRVYFLSGTVFPAVGMLGYSLL